LKTIPGGPNEARGFDLEPVSLTNRAVDPKALPQFVWKKCEADGLLVVSRLGVLDNDLAKVWQPEQPHVSVKQLRDWFVQFPYLSKLRDPQVLARAISEALNRADAKYAIADRHDEAKGEYAGLKFNRLVEINFNSDAVLVHRDVADAQLAKETSKKASTGAGNGPDQRLPSPHSPAASTPRSRSTRTARPRRSATSLSRS
jgi:hypothetical protein